jgi:hypothetical protein
LSAISFLARLPFLFAQYVPFLVWTTNPGTTAESLQRAAYTIIGLLGVAFATAGFAVAFVATANRHGEAISDVFN